MTKLIRKTQQPSDYPSNQIHDAYSTSITDTYSCNYINELGLGEYSTTEKIVGKWINGKPIYRKTITFIKTIPADTELEINHRVNNVDMIWFDPTGCFVWADSGLGYNIPLLGYAGNFTDKIYTSVNKTKVSIYSNGSWGPIWNKYITLLYTKTTD